MLVFLGLLSIFRDPLRVLLLTAMLFEDVVYLFHNSVDEKSVKLLVKLFGRVVVIEPSGTRCADRCGELKAFVGFLDLQDF